MATQLAQLVGGEWTSGYRLHLCNEDFLGEQLEVLPTEFGGDGLRLVEDGKDGGWGKLDVRVERVHLRDLARLGRGERPSQRVL